jgi:hypothetical protein
MLMSTLDKQEGGDHYKRLKIQPWEIIDACGLDFYEGNVIKYILRRKGELKDRIVDLRKAIHCLEHEIELLIAQEPDNISAADYSQWLRKQYIGKDV